MYYTPDIRARNRRGGRDDGGGFPTQARAPLTLVSGLVLSCLVLW